MKVRLLRDARIKMKAGEIVDVSPVDFDYLVSVGLGEPVRAEKPKTVEQPKATQPKKRATKKG